MLKANKKKSDIKIVRNDIQFSHNKASVSMKHFDNQLPCIKLCHECKRFKKSANNSGLYSTR